LSAVRSSLGQRESEGASGDLGVVQGGVEGENGGDYLRVFGLV